jgi:RNA polymerase sigma-70 factor, ECF subfamily
VVVQIELMQHARSGDLGAFEALIAPHIEPACQLAYAIVRDWQEAEDVAQEAALKARRAFGRLRDDTATIRPRYLRIVANEARSRRRGRWWSVGHSPDMEVQAREKGRERWKTTSAAH